MALREAISLVAVVVLAVKGIKAKAVGAVRHILMLHAQRVRDRESAGIAYAVCVMAKVPFGYRTNKGERETMKFTIESPSTIMATLALVFADMHWDEFSTELKMPDGKEDVELMRGEMQHIIGHLLAATDMPIQILLSVWGEEKLMTYVESLTLECTKGDS